MVKKIDKETMHLMQTLKGVKIRNIDKGFKNLKIVKKPFRWRSNGRNRRDNRERKQKYVNVLFENEITQSFINSCRRLLKIV